MFTASICEWSEVVRSRGGVLSGLSICRSRKEATHAGYPWGRALGKGKG